MSEQLKNLLAALAALLLLAILLSPGQQIGPTSFANTQDKDERGLYAMSQWLQASGYKVISHRTRFDSLMQYSQAATLVVNLPTSTAIQFRDFDTLQTWLRSGDQLIVVVDNSYYNGEEELRLFLQSLGIWLSHSDTSDPEESGAEQSDDDQSDEQLEFPDFNFENVEYSAFSEHPLFNDVASISLQNAVNLFAFQFASEVEVVPLYTDLSTGSGPAWLLRSAEYPGGIFVLGHSDFMSNQGLLSTEQQVFAKNLFEQFVARDETIIFADFYQGLSELYDIQALLGDSRFHMSLFAVLLTWLAYVVFYNMRLGPVWAPRLKFSNRDFSMAAGNLYARHTDNAEVNQQLLKRFNNTYRHKHRLAKNGHSVLAHMQTTHLFSRNLQSQLQHLETHLNTEPMKTQRLLHTLYQRLDTP